MVADNPVSTKNKTQIKELLEKLRNKLKGFAIINMQGQLVGKVTDIFLDKSYHLNVVMSKAEAEANSQIYLLSSKYIEKVDAVHRLLFVDIAPVELEQLPLFSMQNKQVAETPGSSRNLSLTEQTASDFKGQELRETDSRETASSETVTPTEVATEELTESDDSSNVLEEELVRLLEERLVVNRRKHKIGEVVVRKEIETQIIEVPIQREILIIEQVGSETKRLAAIDLSKGEVTGVELANPSSSEIHHQKESRHEKGYRVIGDFVSPRAASNLLEAIALQKRHGCEKVRVELTVENPELQKTYQNMFDRCSIR
jgi:stress response protein YsnF